MTTFEEISRRKSDLLRAAASHKARKLRVFGSVARGEDRQDSDVNLLVDFDAGASLLDLVGLQQDFEACSAAAQTGDRGWREPLLASTDPRRSEAALRREPVVSLKCAGICLDWN